MYSANQLKDYASLGKKNEKIYKNNHNVDGIHS